MGNYKVIATGEPCGTKLLDPQGKEVQNATKIEITISPDNLFAPTATITLCDISLEMSMPENGVILTANDNTES
jgi:hypothetical protein